MSSYACIWIGSVCIVWFPLLPILLLLLLTCWCCCRKKPKTKRPEVIEVQYETQEELEWSVFIQEWATRFITCAISRESWNILGTSDEARSIIFSDTFQEYFEEELKRRKEIVGETDDATHPDGLRRRRTHADVVDAGEREEV